MKSPGLTLQFASATLFLALAASRLAAAQDNAAPAAKPAEHTAELMKRFDKDGDGMLDEEELAAAKATLLRELGGSPPATDAATLAEEAYRARMVELFDQNGDGKIDEQERAVAQKEILQRFDKNGNGRIDPEERAAVQEFLRGRRPPPTTGRPPPAPVRGVDDNVALEKVLRAAIEADATQRARFDTDQNGKLDDAEWAAARREILRWAGNGSYAAKPLPPAEEQKRLEAVAAELARRRAARELPKPEAK